MASANKEDVPFLQILRSIITSLLIQSWYSLRMLCSGSFSFKTGNPPLRFELEVVCVLNDDPSVFFSELRL